MCEQDMRLVWDVDADGAWIPMVEQRDGTRRFPTDAERDEMLLDVRCKRRNEMRVQLALAVTKMLQPDWMPPISQRYMQYVAWAEGRAPNYRPTLYDHFMLMIERAKRIHNNAGGAPVRQSPETTPPEPTRRIRLAEAEQLTGRSRSTLRRWIDERLVRDLRPPADRTARKPIIVDEQEILQAHRNRP